MHLREMHTFFPSYDSAFACDTNYESSNEANSNIEMIWYVVYTGDYDDSVFMIKAEDNRICDLYYYVMIKAGQISYGVQHYAIEVQM